MESDESGDLPSVVSADVPTDLARRIEAQREENESRSQTIKRLLRSGLEVEEKSHFQYGFTIAYHWAIAISIIATIGTVVLAFARSYGYTPYPISIAITFAITGGIYAILFYILRQFSLSKVADKYLK